MYFYEQFDCPNWLFSYFLLFWHLFLVSSLSNDCRALLIKPYVALQAFPVSIAKYRFDREINDFIFIIVIISEGRAMERVAANERSVGRGFFFFLAFLPRKRLLGDRRVFTQWAQVTLTLIQKPIDLLFF